LSATGYPLEFPKQHPYISDEKQSQYCDGGYGFRRNLPTEYQMSILLTEKAASEIKKIVLEQGLPEDQTRLRVGVKGGGCSGFSYMLDLTDISESPIGESDEELESNGVKILCDMKSLLYLSGTEIDFKDEVMGKGFVFKNPNATSSCGCGSSFSA
jgi:iron-sulfur cluster assembly protein